MPLPGPWSYAADKTLPNATIYSALTTPAILTAEAPTPVMPVQTVAAPPAPSFLRQPSGRVKPVFLAGGAACIGVAALLFAGPLHRHILAVNGADAARFPKKSSDGPPANGPLTQQANPAPVVSPAVVPPTDQKNMEKSQAHASAELDELIKQQEQTRTEVERLEKLVAAAEAKRKAAESRASAAEAAFAGKSISGAARLTPQQKAQLNPLPPVLPETLVQIASLHPHDQFDFRTKPITRTPDGTILVQVHNARACYVYLYLLQENKNLAEYLPNGERRLSGTPQRNVFTSIGLRLDDPSTASVKLLLLASVKPLNGLPATFTLPNVPKRSPADTAIDRRFALLHDYRDQIVTTMQANHVLLDGKSLQQDDLIVRFLRYKPVVAGEPAPPPRRFGQNGSRADGTGTPQIASIPVVPFHSKDAL